MIELEEILKPLTSYKKNSQDNESNPRLVLQQLLLKLEKRPIKSSEQKIIKNNINDFIKVSQITLDSTLQRAIQYRFAFEFLPQVSNLELEIKQKPKQDINGVRKGPASGLQMEENVEITKPVSPLPKSVSKNPKGFDFLPSNSLRIKTYYLCSIRRHQSTLSNSYRMYLDGYKDMDVKSGDLTRGEMNESPIMLLGAKKMKSSLTSSTCFVWKISDSKLWKEKNAVGKITRTSNIYTGIPLPTGNEATSTPPLSQNNDPITTQNPVMATNSSDNNTIASGASTSSPVVINNSINGVNEPNTSHRNSFWIIDGDAIAIHMNSRSIDKLIHIHALLSNDSTSNQPSDEVKMISELESLVKNQNGIYDTKNYRAVRSKLPRKAGNLGNKRTGIHTLAFGKDSRVRAASRKNLVIDPLVMESSGVTVATNWENDNDRTPMLQIGKMEEDLFAADFYDLSPFQVFTIAMAVFDQ